MSNFSKNAAPLLAKIEADKGMIAETLSLYFARFREEDIVFLTPDITGKSARSYYGDWLSTEDNLEELAGYLAGLSNDFHNAGEAAKPICFCPNPIRADYSKAHWCGSPTLTSADIAMRNWLLFDLDRKDSSKLPAPTKAELDILAQAKEYLLQLLASRKFNQGSWIVTDSGNGWHVDVPVALENTAENDQLVDALYKDFANLISSKFPAIDFDKTKDAKRFWSLPGTHNLKYPDTPKLRQLSDYPSKEQIASSVNQNNQAFFAVTLALLASKAKDEKVPSKSVKGASADDGALARWETETSWEEILSPLGCALYSKGSSRELWTRPGKNTSEGASLIAGARHEGAGDTLYNLSSNLGNFPQNTNIRKYRAYLMAKGILSVSGAILDEDEYRKFFRDVKKRYGVNSLDSIYQNQMHGEPLSITVAANPLPAPAMSVSEDSIEYKSKPGTLDDIVLPGDIEIIAQDLNAGSPIDNIGLARATALGLFSFLVGKTVVDGTGKYCNLYVINLGKSCSGKAAAGKYATKFLHEMQAVLNTTKDGKPVLINDVPYDFGSITVRGSKFGSPEGVHTKTVLHGRVLFIGDESEDFLLPGVHESSGSAREANMLLLSHSDGSRLSGRALASGLANPDVECPFYVQIHTTQPGIFWTRVQERHAIKGILSRHVIIKVGDGEIKYLPKGRSKVSDDVSGSIRYWGARNRKKLEAQNFLPANYLPPPAAEKWAGSYFLGKFSPPCTTLEYLEDTKDLRFKYQKSCRKLSSISEDNGEYIAQQAYGRAHEHAQAMAVLFTIAVDREAKAITPEAWKLAQLISERCVQNVLSSCKHVGDLREYGMRKRILDNLNSEHLKVDGKYLNPLRDGITERDLRRSVHGIIKTNEDFQAQLGVLESLEKIRLQQERAGGKDRYRIFLVDDE